LQGLKLVRVSNAILFFVQNYCQPDEIVIKQGAHTLHQEIASMEAILQDFNDAFSAPSVLQVMQEEQRRADDSTFQRRASSAGRKPGSELLWPFKAVSDGEENLGPNPQQRVRSASVREEVEKERTCAHPNAKINVDGSTPLMERANDTQSSAHEGVTAVARPTSGPDAAQAREDSARPDGGQLGGMRYAAASQEPGCSSPAFPAGGNSSAGGGVGGGGEDQEDEEEMLAEYLAHAQELADAEQKLGLHVLECRKHGRPAGLHNQGATCYLNSLLQHLFHTPELRAFLYCWKFDPDAHGTAERCIPRQMQLLFARLEHSSAAAVGTEGLTKAFGWDRAQVCLCLG
jgi:hypothetical protein